MKVKCSSYYVTMKVKCSSYYVKMKFKCSSYYVTMKVKCSSYYVTMKVKCSCYYVNKLLDKYLSYKLHNSGETQLRKESVDLMRLNIGNPGSKSVSHNKSSRNESRWKWKFYLLCNPECVFENCELPYMSSSVCIVTSLYLVFICVLCSFVGL